MNIAQTYLPAIDDYDHTCPMVALFKPYVLATLVNFLQQPLP